MTTYKDLKAEFEKKLEELKVDYEKNVKITEEEFHKKVKDLQKNCKHPKVSVMLIKREDKKEKVCEICNAIIKKAKITIHMP